MELEDFFNFKDFFRTMLLASSLFFIIGTSYGVLLHAMYSSQVMGVKQDLADIAFQMENKTEEQYNINKTTAREYRRIAERAEEFSKNVNPPPVTPNAYSYLNYWIIASAFTQLDLDYEDTGLDEKSVKTLEALNDTEAFGITGWWDNPRFYLKSTKTGTERQLLPRPPYLETYFLTFYFFIMIVGFSTAFLVIKEEYEVPSLPEAIYGAFMPLPFFAIYAFTSILSIFNVGLIKPDQVNILAILASFIIMSILCMLSSVTAVALRTLIQQQMEKLQ